MSVRSSRLTCLCCFVQIFCILTDFSVYLFYYWERSVSSYNCGCVFFPILSVVALRILKLVIRYHIRLGWLLLYPVHSPLSVVSIEPPSFILFSVLMVYVFQPFTFNIFISLYLKWIYYRQHVVMCCFVFIHSDNFCL